MCPGPDEIQVTAFPAGQTCSGDAQPSLTEAPDAFCSKSLAMQFPIKTQPCPALLPTDAASSPPLARIPFSCCMTLPQQSQAPPDPPN